MTLNYKNVSFPKVYIKNIKMTCINSMVGLKAFKTIWKIKVKIVQLWKQYCSLFSRICSMEKIRFLCHNLFNVH